MIKIIASFFSVLFHPLFLFFYLILYLVYFTDLFLLYRYSPHLWMFLLYVFLNTVVIPIIIILFYSRDLMLKDKENRTIPYIIMIVVYGFMLFFFIRFYISVLVLRYLISLIIGLISLTIINIFYKPSLHTFAMGSLMAFFIRIYFLHPGMFFYPLMIMILLAGITGSARLALNAHTKEELLAGYGIGTVVTFVVLLV
jgi:hypothetical protein